MRITRLIIAILLTGALIILVACAPASPTPPASTQAPTATPTASFTTSDMTITPKTARLGEPVEVGVMVTNTGGQQGTYTVVMKLHDGTIVKTQDVTLSGGAKQNVTLNMSMNSVGTHMIMIDKLVGSLVVQATTTPPAITQPAPARATGQTSFTDGIFTISDLTVTPKVQEPGGKVTVGILVRNNGGQPDTYKVVLKVQNNKTKAEDVKTQDVTMAGGASQEVNLTITAGLDGTYTVIIDKLSGNLLVDEHANM